MLTNKYDHQNIESKWQALWVKEITFKAEEKSRKNKVYVLDMFPYPSAQGLHVGHAEGYTATDIYCRFIRMKGINVLHPMGWDAFGLPAENYAIKTSRHPQEVTWESIANYRRQLQSLGFSYDWTREVNTAGPEYYKWTQWLFLKLYDKDLAYQKEAPVNWCPSCQTVLANEQVVTGECERCGSQVEQRQMNQWFFKITDYADELLKDLDKLDWPDNIVEMQKNWIGKSEGAEVNFPIFVPSGHLPQGDNSQLSISVFTTRLDTIYGATYLVLAPEHELVQQLKSEITNWLEVEKYIRKTQGKTELERKAETKEKTGVQLEGLIAVNPASQEKIPIFIADYVLTSYGTGAIMAVPAHDKRDFEFAEKFGLPIICVIDPIEAYAHESSDDSLIDAKQKTSRRIERIKKGEEVYIGPGHLMNSGKYDGFDSNAAISAIAKKLGVAQKIQYRLRDWLISRQRYWGAPIPIIYCQKCGTVPMPEKDLPVVLPDDVNFRPTGESPLVRSKSFHNVRCPKCDKPARRESDTMDTFVDSSWYWLRYCDPQNNKEAFDAKKVQTWCPINLYVGGAEHAVMHLLYARFITKVLYDLGYIKFREPFLKLRNQGLILGEDGQKMSKSRGNVVNPDEIVARHGADTFRLYEMFMGPLEDAKPWNTASIIGMRRFLERIWQVMAEIITRLNQGKFKPANHQSRAIHVTVKKVSDDIESFKFNTAISALMEYFNKKDFIAENKVDIEAVKKFLMLLYPFVPHISAELWQGLEVKKMIWEQDWPSYDKAWLKQELIEITIQVNGKLRGTIECEHDVTEKKVATLAENSTNTAKYLAGKKIIRTIYVPGKLINFVVE